MHVEKEPCIGNLSQKLLDVWKNQLEVARSNLKYVLLEEYVEKYFKLEAKFKSVFGKHIVKADCVNFVRTEIFVLNVWKDLRVTMNFLIVKLFC